MHSWCVGGFGHCCILHCNRVPCFKQVACTVLGRESRVHIVTADAPARHALAFSCLVWGMQPQGVALLDARARVDGHTDGCGVPALGWMLCYVM